MRHILSITCIAITVSLLFIDCANGAATQVSAGSNHSCSLTDAGGVQCWGDNSFGQLGNGTNVHSNAAVNVSGLAGGVRLVSAGAKHSCALLTAGGVKCWGDNSTGQLGNGGSAGSNVPVNVTGLISTAGELSTGDNHTCVNLDIGNIMCWGDNTFGQLGIGTTAASNVPVLVEFATHAALITTKDLSHLGAGAGHTCASDSSGQLYCWGDNRKGQLGINVLTTPEKNPSAVVGLARRQISNPRFPSNYQVNVRSLSAGAVHNCIAGDDGPSNPSVNDNNCWGDNPSGQFGNGSVVGSLNTVASDNGRRYEHISVGFQHTCAVDAANHLYCWGGNSNGQLGVGGTGASSVPVAVTQLPDSIAEVKSVDAGEFHSCAITKDSIPAKDGLVVCWGKNSNGAVGNGSNTDSNVPVKVKQTQVITFAVLSAQTLGGPAINMSATTSAGLAVVFSAVTPSVCSVSGAKVTLLTVGACTIRASQLGDTTYAAAPDVEQSFNITASGAGGGSSSGGGCTTGYHNGLDPTLLLMLFIAWIDRRAASRSARRPT